MCGICGKINFGRQNVDKNDLLKMMDAMLHRGPDDQGFYIAGNVGLGHRRLSIIDLSTGHQPLSNEDDTVWVVFNGEIYNFEEVRSRLLAKGHQFKTKTDTEVIIHAYEEFGVDCLAQLRGMFTFALWDSRRQIVFCARDRVGIKPLYYTTTNQGFLFASEIKALLTDTSVDKTINHQAIDRALSFYYLPGDMTMFKQIHKLLPGHYAIIQNERITINKYWDLTFSPDYTKSFKDATNELLDRIRESVRLHMISDVPVGFLLSGGVDSTALLSLAIHETQKEISTFTIGFEGQNFADERPFAKIASNKFGTKHYDMTIRASEFLDFLPSYISIMEEPVCEPPAIALYFISKLAKEHVKVLISGEGGDEAFAGYPNYRTMLLLDKLRKTIPFGRELLMQAIKAPFIAKRMSKFKPFLELPLTESYFSRVSSPCSYFNKNFKEFYTPDFLASINRGSSEGFIANDIKPDASLSLLNAMLYIDSKTWLPDDLLVKADKMTMANSIELRVPLLDHKILEFAGTLPERFKVHNFSTKIILKNAFKGIVPTEIIKRKKTGFPVPYEKWLREEYKGQLSDLLLSSTAISRGYFRKCSIEKMLTQNEQKGNLSRELFTLAVLELWHQKYHSI
jgi:asparagine synthase (glutamine-hydrolysing)